MYIFHKMCLNLHEEEKDKPSHNIPVMQIPSISSHFNNITVSIQCADTDSCRHCGNSNVWFLSDSSGKTAHLSTISDNTVRKVWCVTVITQLDHCANALRWNNTPTSTINWAAEKTYLNNYRLAQRREQIIINTTKYLGLEKHLSQYLKFTLAYF